MNLMDMRRVLRLYFIQQLAEDESIRAENTLHPQYQHASTIEGIDFFLDEYKESLVNEKDFGLDRAMELNQSYALALTEGSSDFKQFYREFVKVEIELLGILRHREYCDYKRELGYLYDDHSGLSAPIFATLDPETRPLELLTTINAAISASSLQVESGRASGEARRRQAEADYSAFDDCVRSVLENNSENSNTHIATICKRRTAIDREERSLRARVTKIRQE